MKVSSRAPVEPTTTRVTETLTITALKRVQAAASRRGSSPTSVSIAQAAAIGPPEVTTTAVRRSPALRAARPMPSRTRPMNSANDSG